MKYLRLSTFLVALLVLSAPLFGASVPDQPPDPRAAIQEQLSTFFDPQGPSIFGQLPKSSLEKLRNGVASLDAGEVERLQQALNTVPEWDGSPQALGLDLPSEAFDSIHSVSAKLRELAPAGERTLSELKTLVEVLQLMSDERLAELGLDRALVDSLGTNFEGMDIVEAAVLQQHLTASPEFDRHRMAALNALPAGLKEGAAALAEHGPLTEEDIGELNEYSKRFSDLAERADRLSAEARERLRADMIRRMANGIKDEKPEMIFIVRERVTAEQLDRLEEIVDLHERIGSMSFEELTEIETFRDELLAVLDRAETVGPEQLSSVATLSHEELLALRDEVGGFPEWQTALTAAAEAVSSSAVQAQFQQSAFDPGRTHELETFRQQSISYIVASMEQGDVNRDVASQAREMIAGAPLNQLAVYQSAVAALPVDASAAARLSTIPITTQALSKLNINCVVNLGSVTIPVIDKDVSLGSINFNFLCNPIESVVNSVIDVVNFLEATVNAIPDTLKNAITSLFNFLLDQVKIGGVSIRDLANGDLSGLSAALQSALGLGSSWWTAISGFTLPQVPCPPAGFHTPFGEVGTGDAVTTFNQYKFFIDELLEMIPATEISLAVKVPAQVAFAAFKFLGTCLETAANAADEQLATNRYTEITANQGSLSVQSATETTALSVQMSNLHGSLSTLINNSTTDSQDLVKRLAIEAALMAGHSEPLGVFILPSPWGLLERVREVVRTTLDGMSAVGLGSPKAEKEFDAADAAMNAGDYKEAFKLFQRAYATVVR